MSFNTIDQETILVLLASVDFEINSCLTDFTLCKLSAGTRLVDRSRQ